MTGKGEKKKGPKKKKKKKRDRLPRTRGITQRCGRSARGLPKGATAPRRRSSRPTVAQVRGASGSRPPGLRLTCLSSASRSLRGHLSVRGRPLSRRPLLSLRRIRLTAGVASRLSKMIYPRTAGGAEVGRLAEADAAAAEQAHVQDAAAADAGTPPAPFCEQICMGHSLSTWPFIGGSYPAIVSIRGPRHPAPRASRAAPPAARGRRDDGLAAAGPGAQVGHQRRHRPQTKERIL